MRQASTPEYRQQLDVEAAVWAAEAERQSLSTPPDWSSHRLLRHNIVTHRADIDALLSTIRPGMVTVELGCSSGWLTLAMAQRGAVALGLDISHRSLQIARRYYESIENTVSGHAVYRAVDLNLLRLPEGRYDVIAVKGTLHHLVRADHVIDEVHRALKPGGLFWISDSRGDEALATVVTAGALALVLPTHVSYREKIRGLVRHGTRSASRVRASIQAEGLSPFEGAGRGYDWLEIIARRFVIERMQPSPAVTGYVAHQIKLPDRVAIPVLRILRVLDRTCVRLKILPSTGLVVYARKASPSM